MLKRIARIILHIVAALLLRHTEIIGRNQHLDIALKLHDGKQAKRDAHRLFWRGNAEVAVERPADALRCRAAALALAAIARAQSFASRQIGSTHWTFALGFVLVGRNCSSASSEEYSDEKIRTLPSLPKRIHFFEKEVRPSTVQGGFIGVV